MKTKIAQLFFTTALMLTMNFGADIGGTTLPPKPPTGPACKSVDLNRNYINSTQRQE